MRVPCVDQLVRIVCRERKTSFLVLRLKMDLIDRTAGGVKKLSAGYVLGLEAWLDRCSCGAVVVVLSVERWARRKIGDWTGC